MPISEEIWLMKRHNYFMARHDDYNFKANSAWLNKFNGNRHLFIKEEEELSTNSTFKNLFRINIEEMDLCQIYNAGTKADFSGNYFLKEHMLIKLTHQLRAKKKNEQGAYYIDVFL